MFESLSGKVILFSGCIGAGKTTTIKYLANYFEEEGIPVHAECEELDPEALSAFYKHMKELVTPWEGMVTGNTLRRVKRAYAAAKDGKVVFLDRGFIDVLIFCHQLRNDSVMDDYGYDMMVQLLLSLTTEIKDRPALGVFLDVPAETCHTRMLERGRDSEKGVSLTYLEDLIQEHNWVLFMDQERKEVAEWPERGFIRYNNDRPLNCKKLLETIEAAIM